MSQQYYFITGTSQGIGKALAERALEEASATVYGISRSQTITHAQYRHIAFDLSDTDALIRDTTFFFPALKEAERIVLINNAGSLGEVKYVGQWQEQLLLPALQLNVVAPAILMNRFIRAYQHYPAEKLIINVSSGAGKYPVDGWAEYCASKAALDMLTQVAALEQEKAASQGVSPISMYALSPGVVDTAMQASIRQTNPKDFSTIDRFLNLKENDELSDARATAEKFFYLIQHHKTFREVLQDVREF